MNGAVGGAQQGEAVSTRSSCSCGARLTRPPSSLSPCRTARASPASHLAEPVGAALHDQRGGDGAAPGGDPRQARAGAASARRSASRAPRDQRPQQPRAIVGIPARQDVGRISRPEQQPPADQIGPPGDRPGRLGMRRQPGAGQLLRRRAWPRSWVAAAARSRSQAKLCSRSHTSAGRSGSVPSSPSTGTSWLPAKKRPVEQSEADRPCRRRPGRAAR